jgi:hypothetical protein
MVSSLFRRLGRALPSPHQAILPDSWRFRELVLRVFLIELLAAAARAKDVHPSDSKKIVSSIGGLWQHDLLKNR